MQMLPEFLSYVIIKRIKCHRNKISGLVPNNCNLLQYLYHRAVQSSFFQTLTLEKKKKFRQMKKMRIINGLYL